MPTDRIKILMVIDDASLGGGQKHLLSLVQYIDKTKFEVEVACEEKGYLVDELKKINIKVHPLYISNLPSIRSIISFNKLVKQVKPSIIHSHGGTAGFYCRITSLFNFSGGIAHTYHGIHYLNFNRSLTKYIFRFVDRLLLGLTDCTICVAQNDFDLGMQNGVVKKEKAVVIKNGIEVDKFLQDVNQSSLQPNIVEKKNSVIVGSVGRLHHQKGYEYLIKSSRIILEKFPDTKFIIAGDGELKSELENLCKNFKVDHAFTFLGSRNDIPNLLRQFDIFVLPSLWEGLPIVILEAMAAKKSIVATNVNGTIEVIESGENGILVPPKDPEALALAIISLIENPQLRSSLAVKAFDKVSNEFNITEMVKRTEEVYLSICSRKIC